MLVTGGLEPMVLKSWTWRDSGPRGLRPTHSSFRREWGRLFCSQWSECMRKGEEYAHLHTADQISFGCPAQLAVKDAEWCRPAHTHLPTFGFYYLQQKLIFPNLVLASDWITSWIPISSIPDKPKTCHGVWVHVCGSSPWPPMQQRLLCHLICWDTLKSDILKRGKTHNNLSFWSDFYVLWF